MLRIKKIVNVLIVKDDAEIIKKSIVGKEEFEDDENLSLKILSLYPAWFGPHGIGVCQSCGQQHSGYKLMSQLIKVEDILTSSKYEKQVADIHYFNLKENNKVENHMLAYQTMK